MLDASFREAICHAVICRFSLLCRALFFFSPVVFRAMPPFHGASRLRELLPLRHHCLLIIC